jgi:HSP20 family protein
MPVWDPFREFDRLEREMRRMFDNFWGGRRGFALPGPRRTALPAERAEGLVGSPAVDLIDKKDSLIVRAEMPGLKKKDVKVQVTDDDITVSGKIERTKEEKEENYYCCERAYSAWERTMPLPTEVKADEVKAKYEDGILEIILPKTEPAKAKPKVREIKIE